MSARFFLPVLRIVFWLGLVWPGALAVAQTPDGAGDNTIAQIRIEGNRRIDAETVRSYLLVEPGDRFEAQQIDLSLKTLFATGLFADVLIDRDGDDLVIRVTENPIINQVLFEGNRSIRTDKLEEETEAEARSVFTQARVQKDVQRILESYRRAGRFAASVSPEYKELDQNRVDLIFVISEGPKTGVHAINFIGNTHFSDARLRRVILTNESRWWAILDKNDNYDPDRLEYDRELLRQYYSDHGFADFRVESAVAALAPDREGFYITLTISEGAQYNFGKIEVETELEKISASFLRKTVPIQAGDPYQGSLIEQAVDTLVFATGAAGFAHVDVRPLVNLDTENKTVSVSFVVNEGPLVYIERIDITGNTRTLQKVIRREIRLSEGDTFNRVLLDTSRNRLRALRFFSEVEITETPGSAPDRTIVQVALKEQATGSLALSLGYSTVESFLVNFEITQANLGGRGQRLALSARYSTYARSGNFSFTEPKFLGGNMSLGGNIFVTDYTYASQTGYDNLAAGWGLQSGLPLGKRRQLGLSYRFRYDDLTVDQTYKELYCNPAAFAFESSICQQEGARITSAVGYSLSMDRRNDPINPTGGYNLYLSQELAGLGGSVRYVRTEARASIYQDLFWGMVASFRASAGHIIGYAGGEIRINDRFRKGGFTFRGFQYNGIGPREVLYTTQMDDNGQPVESLTTRGLSLGGNIYAIGTLEINFPIPYIPEEAGLSAGVFLEFGTVTGLDASVRDRELIEGDNRWFVADSGKVRASMGLSLFWDTQVGPLQFDFSTIISQEEYDAIETFRFSTRTQF